MKSFAIIGLGNFGTTLALTLAQNQHQVLVIDEDAEKVEEISDYVTNAVIGDSTDRAVLETAGITDYDCAVVAISNNMECSILTTLLLEDMGISQVVARAVSDNHAKVLQRVGADIVVFPERDMGEKLAYKLDKNNVLDYIEFSEDYSLVEAKVPVRWVGKSLRELDIRRKYKINIIAVIKDHPYRKIEINPDPDAPFEADDTLAMVGLNSDLDKVNG
ncbi:MAG: TrkA family potassium uptake protein [Ruminococcaceae bacterium]|nr:TrkA family potassium uptake protein [Oscillospiraceae bacterium]